MGLFSDMGKGYETTGWFFSDGWDHITSGNVGGVFLGVGEWVGGVLHGVGNTITFGQVAKFSNHIADSTEMEDFDGDGTLDIRMKEDADGFTKAIGTIVSQPAELMGQSVVATDEAIVDGDQMGALKNSLGFWGGLAEVAATSVALEMGGSAIASGVSSLAAGTTTVGSAVSGANTAFSYSRLFGGGVLRSSASWVSNLAAGMATTKVGIVTGTTLSLAGSGLIMAKASDFAKAGNKSIEEYLLTDLNGHETDSLMAKLTAAGCLTPGKEDAFREEFLNTLNGIDKGINYGDNSNITQVGEQYDMADVLMQLEQKGYISDNQKAAEIIYTDYYTNYYSGGDFPDKLREDLIKASVQCSCGTVDARYYCQTMYTADGYMGGMTMDQAVAYADYMTSLNMGDFGDDMTYDEFMEMMREDDDLKDVPDEIFNNVSCGAEFEINDVIIGIKESTLQYFKELGLYTQEDIDSGSLPEGVPEVISLYSELASMYSMGALSQDELKEALRSAPVFDSLSDDQLFGFYRDQEGFEQYAIKEGDIVDGKTVTAEDLGKDSKETSTTGVGAALAGVGAQAGAVAGSAVQSAKQDVIEAGDKAEGTLSKEEAEQFKQDVKDATTTETPSDENKKKIQNIVVTYGPNGEKAGNGLNFFRAINEKLLDVCPGFATLEAALIKGASNIMAKLCNTEDKYANMSVTSLANSISEQAEMDATIYGDKVVTSEESRQQAVIYNEAKANEKAAKADESRDIEMEGIV